MELHKSCPECRSRILADSTSCRCGWQADGGKTSDKTPVLCAWYAEGRQCVHRGIISLGGPVYCREHAMVLDGRKPELRGNAPPEPLQSMAVKGWHRKMAEHKAGLATPAVRERSPGDDDEEVAA